MSRTLDQRMNLELTGEKVGRGVKKRLRRRKISGRWVPTSVSDAAWLASEGNYDNLNRHVPHHEVEYRPCEKLTVEEYLRRKESEK